MLVNIPMPAPAKRARIHRMDDGCGFHRRAADQSAGTERLDLGAIEI